ncbi:MAG: copper transporter [Actinomycetota bacterium]|nr:copper transporter [Actinomycetota bacterium]
MGEVDRVISWRYHVVSLVGVVLAFGLGILAGTSVLDDRFVDQLERNNAEARRERDAAVALTNLYERFAVGLQPALRDGVLVGEEAIIVTMDGVDRPAQRTVDELTTAGVEVLATLELTRGLAEPEIEENAAALEGILSVSGSDPEALRDEVADALAVRLAVGALSEEDDVLGDLLTDGFVTADRDLEPGALLGIGGEGQLVVIAAGGPPPTGFPGPDALLVPFTERLVGLDVATAAVGPVEDAYGFVSAVRDTNGIPDCSMVTVDDIDLAIGGITLAMAIDRFLNDADAQVRPGGDYGIRGDSILPGAAEPPDSCLA